MKAGSPLKTASMEVQRTAAAEAAQDVVPEKASVKEKPGSETMVFTVDVEEYFHVTAFSGSISKSQWGGMQSRIERSLNRLLEILDANSVKATFFVLGWVALENRRLVREIQSLGHEIASHGFNHELIYQQEPEDFRSDISRSKKTLEDITGEEVTGYRAPTFSITPKSAWAYDILAQEGYRYSSSVFPVRHDRYGWPDFGGYPRKMDVGDEREFWEFPLMALRLGFLQIPYGGGGYLRIYPFDLTKFFLRLGKDRKKIRIFYLHPWEVDPDQPKVLNASRAYRFRHYLNLRRSLERLRMLIEAFRDIRFVTCHQYIREMMRDE